MSSPARSGLGARHPAGAVLPFPINSRNKRIALIALLVFIGLLAGMLLLYWIIWPFSQKAVVQDLSEASDSTVLLGQFRPTFFPHPGCIIGDVRFERGPQHFTFITIQKLTIQGSYLGILRRHVQRIVAVGAHVFFPAFGKGIAFHTRPSKIVIEELVGDGSVVEFAASNPHSKPLRFELHSATLNHVQQGQPIHYRLKFHNPNPPSEITASGDFGPWPPGHPEQIPMSGKYNLDQGDLSGYGGIAGHIDSTGNFHGTFQHIEIEGATESKDFEVTSAHHPENLSTRFQAYVNAINGDTFLSHVEARLARTVLVAKGSIARNPASQGKFARLQFVSHQGRIEDILGLFVQSPRSPMSGPLSLQTLVEIPAGPQPFLKRVKLDGTFGIDNGRFSQSSTQTDVNKLSAGARGENKEDPETVLTDLAGKVVLADGLARFADLSFRVPGAHARLHGTYSILNYKINLHGHMRVDTNISKQPPE
jgi:hypothetical protein